MQETLVRVIPTDTGGNALLRITASMPCIRLLGLDTVSFQVESGVFGQESVAYKGCFELPVRQLQRLCDAMVSMSFSLEDKVEDARRAIAAEVKRAQKDGTSCSQ